MKTLKLLFVVFLFGLIGCIGDDLVEDFVEPQVRISNPIDTLAVGETYQLEAQFFNNVGQEEESTFVWTSSDEEVAAITEEGLLWARTKGLTTVGVTVNYNGEDVTLMRDVVIDEETVEAATERQGSLRTTSSYALQGDFVLTKTDDGVRLSFSEDYATDDVLPGLYIYLTNNPSTVNDALVISEVTVFEGSHEYEIEDVELNDYSHVLYFCKPFNVKVGDGAFE